MRTRLNIIVSILFLLLASFSIGGATMAWFTAGHATLQNIFTAGTVIISDPVIISQSNPDWEVGADGKRCNLITWRITNEGTKTAYIRVRPDVGLDCVVDYQNFCEWPDRGPIALDEDFGFVPNSGEASISKVDLIDEETVARYWTAPRLGDNGNTIHPGAWRTSRLQVDFDGNAWVLNTGADIYLNDPSDPSSGYRSYDPATGLVGSVVRLQGNTDGLPGTNDDHTTPLPFGTDQAIKIFEVGDIGDIPRAVAVSENNVVWIGFYGGQYFQKYQYDSVAETLSPVGARITGVAGISDNFVPYDATIDCDGRLWFSSRGSIPTISPRREGVFSFDTNMADPVVIRHSSFNPYSVFVDTDNYVWVTAYNRNLYRSDGTANPDNISLFTTAPTISNQLRGLTMDYDGKIWIAYSILGGDGSSDYVIRIDPETGDTTAQIAIDRLPVGVGRDAAGFIWVVCRDDGKSVGNLHKINPNNPGLGVLATVSAGNRPYVYTDFTKPIPPECEEYVTWSIGPDCEDYWLEGVDGWWYYGSVAEPIVVESGGYVDVCFLFCIHGSYDGNIDIVLEAEAVQTTHGAIDYTWPENPWYVFNPYPSLRVTKVADKETAFVGETINYTITVTNNGNLPFDDVSVTDVMLAIAEQIDTLPVGGSQVFNGSYEVVAGDMPGPLVNSASAITTYEGNPVSASASASVILTSDPPIPFTDLDVGDYVLISNNDDPEPEPVLFQKIGDDWVLLRDTSGTATWDNANSAGIAYSANFAGTAVESSRLLTRIEVLGIDELSILANGLDWWTSTRVGNSSNYWYVDENGDIQPGNQDNIYGIRPSLFLQSDLYVTGGDGTAGDPYILIIPVP